MTKYTIVTIDGKETPVKKSDFDEALRTGNYEQYVQGGVHVLLHKANERSADAYRVHHNDVANQCGKNDRLNRCLDEQGRVCRRDCKQCDRERESRVPVSLSEREENGIQHPDNEPDIVSALINKEMTDELRAALALLEKAERDLVCALYLDETATMADYAKVSGSSYAVIRSLRDRAFRKIAKIAGSLRNYL